MSPVERFMRWTAAADQTDGRWALRFFGSAAIAGVALFLLIFGLILLAARFA